MKIKFDKKEITIEASKVSRIGMFAGLMFKTSQTKNLLFEFGNKNYNAIHSFFVFFPFLAIWLDDKNNVLDFSFVSPFTPSVKPRKLSKKLIEIPLNKKNREILRYFRR